MRAALAPGEILLPGTLERAEALFARPEVAAVLVPLVPQGSGVLPRAARRYLATWDRRFLHPMNHFAPATRVLSRERLPGPHNADAAPILATAIARGARVEALREGGVATHIGDDLGAWTAHFRAEGEAWGVLARREAGFAGFLPPPWWRHSLAQAPRRVIEILEAVRRPDPLAMLLHLTREAAFSSGCGARASREG